MKQNGCAEFVHGTVDIHFPADHIECGSCWLLHRNGERYFCGRTGEIITNTRTIGYDCPINFKEEL